MPGVFTTAANAFEETLDELGFRDRLSELGDLAALGRRAALLAVAGELWGQHLGPLLDADQVAGLLGVRSRQAVSDLARRSRLLALDAAAGRKLYPALQFAPNGRPWDELAPILEIFAEVAATPYTTASWLASPNPNLDGKTPLDWLRSGRESEELLQAARRAASRLAH